ncbi:MAG: nucleoside triphosphate pyrophosphohydrolase family protein [Flavobacteriaceae bacterium]|jgi:predicted HAD superfamily Cof-like phosphohydrolase|nr:nucleoside triphosphate pyrophosphohydrolase family protein [Flavobacteriaceae bacterium]MBT5233577.1 nucleoside triphosphate pyrophosphohydrolase family protein [Flavobacteriaceae bacterium]MBT7572808.1 nucleoside triphosphate pyrophosphohydrolase family protein [Flavobacteriaceae bacterium]MDA7566840.1 nucleoside triphosphate pyrophosphohydrolase family protein [Flavobacteriaceae bacterium]MDB0022831.1 nucleoside triphosphate pyrophosphohydrolase family protein [Flavobacteriaceae bacterium|tara:strand:+ start:3211 stop:3594 length:384 start_codon:yes stop_codon:yes gene_type:complete
MKHQIEAVKIFHEIYKLSYKENPTTEIGLDKIKLRFNLMAEENQEYLQAAKNNDLVEVADALGDMLYILCGTIIEHGMQDKIEEIFDEIQKSNLSKLGEDGKPIYRNDGKVMKGPNYFKPDISKVLN